MGEEKKPDVFNTQAPPKREAPDFDTIYSVNEKGYSEAQKAEAKELADVARSQWETREAKLAIDLNPPAPAAEDVLDMPSKESTDTVNNEVKLNRLSEPRYKIEKDMDAPFDLVELPSRGKIGPYNKDRLKMAKLTTADEDILTSYGIVESGEFFAPTAGFVSVFQNLHVDSFFALSVDSPFVGENEINKIIEVDNIHVDATIAKTDYGIQPMCGIYHRSLEDRFIDMLNKDNHKLGFLLKSSNTTYVNFEDEKPFLNLNHPHEYKEALNLI